MVGYVSDGMAYFFATTTEFGLNMAETHLYTIKELKPSAADAEIVEGKILNRASDDQLKEWIAGL